MSSSTENVKLGTCNVFFDGKELGLTKGGVEVEVASETHEVLVDQYGRTPISELLVGRTVMVTVPMAETTLDNMLRIMPGSQLITDGAFATGTITFSTAAPVNNDKVTIHGYAFTFKTAPKNEGEVALGATVNEAAQNLTDAINGVVLGVTASVAGAVVTVTAENRSVDDNITITAAFATGANITVVGMTGGMDVTLARVDVKTGININLLDVARQLRLRPIGTSGHDDFIVWKAACPGALSFTYNTEQERIYNAVFKGYVDTSGTLFSVGDEDAA